MKPKLQVSRVSFSYHSKNRETLALSDISFNVDTGEFIAIVGPSGCGKSTLLSLLCGLNMPEAGAIFLDGELLEKNPKMPLIGLYVPEGPPFEWRIFFPMFPGLEIQKKLNTETKQELSTCSLTMDLPVLNTQKALCPFRRYASESRSHTYTGTETGSAFIR